jgi:hypothetical protein
MTNESGAGAPRDQIIRHLSFVIHGTTHSEQSFVINQ